MSRRNAWRVAGLVSLVFLAGQGIAWGADATLPTGVKVVWDLSKASRETTPTSERICINGLWRWQPATGEPTAVPGDNWGFFKVPGPWPGNSSWIQRDSQKVYEHPSWRNVTPSKVGTAWYQREITIPDGWKGRRLTVYTEYLNSYAAVYVDGTRAGEMYFPSGEVDVTSACPAGTKHVLSLYVKAAPLSATVQAFNDTGAPKQVQGNVERPGLCGDVYLVSTPAGARIGDVKVDTSVRKWEITFSAALADLKPDVKYRLRAQVSDKGERVAELASDPFTAADVKDGRVLFTRPWHPTKLWDVHTPQNIYHVSVSLVDAQDKPLDVFRPVRFGFREIWTQGHDFYLNGTRFYCSIMATDNAQLGVGWSTYDAAKETFLRDKSFGINLLYTHNYGCQPGSHVGYEEILRAADDVGMLISFSQPHYGHYDWKGTDAEKTNGYLRHAAFYVRMAENHPSVVMYSMNHNSYSYGGDDHPDLIDGRRNVQGQIGERTDRGAQNALTVQRIVESLDPTRIVYHHSSGSLGHAYTLNLYLNWTPIQEVSDWFEHWSREAVKPLVLCEFDTPYDLDWTMYRGWYNGSRAFGSAACPWEFCVGEWNSQLLGDRAFDLANMDKENLRWEAQQWRAGRTWRQWDYRFEVVGESTSGNKHKNEARAMYITDNWRAFRTWGVSALNEFGWSPFWSLREGVKAERKDFKVDWEGIQKPGFSPDSIAQPYDRMDLGFEKSDWVPGGAAQALLRNNMPLLAYIGGKEEHVTAKDHNFLPGESFAKQIIVINNSRVTQDCDCSWSLALPQAIAGSRKVTVKTEDQASVPLPFALPANVKSGNYELTMTAKFTSGETQTDTFQVNVLPTVPAVLAKRPRTALFDPKGETAKLLKDMGVTVEPVAADANLDGYSILIVGKEAIPLTGPGPNISKLRDGLTVIMFEQTADVLEKRFGFRVQEYGLRNVFERIPDHPILAGLTNENLHDWRGQATLTPARLTDYTIRQRTGERLKKWCGIEVTRPWRCGNWGNVASVLIEKPAKGDFLPIVDGGYSLQFSPLMLHREGKGLMLLCQMDVTGRTESDPAARRLVTNMLDYVAGYSGAVERKLLYAGDDAGLQHLRNAGLNPVVYQGEALNVSQVLVVGPGAAGKLADKADAVKGWVKEGGNLFAIGLGQEDANTLLPFTVKTKKEEHICTVFAPNGMKSLLAGVGPADVLNRDPRQMELVTGGATVLGNGVLATAPDANVVFCQMAPWQFDYQKYYNQKRTFRRTAYLVSRVLGNMGVGGSTPLLERFSGAVPAGAGEEKFDAFYLDRPQEMDDPYRSFGW